MFAAELLRLDVVRVAPSHRGSHSSAAHRRGGKSGWGLARELALGLGTLAAAAIASSRLIASRRRPKGALVVWRGPRWRYVDPVDLDGPVELADLFQAGAHPTKWSVRWDRRAPALIGPDGFAVHLVADETKTVGTAPPSTFTWFPDGIDTSLSGEPPGRPIGAAAVEPISTTDRN